MTPHRTEPSIAHKQNSENCLRLLRAQRRLYTDAKLVHNTRLAVVLLGAVAGTAAALAWPAGRTTLSVASAVALLVLSLVGSGREKRKAREAAAVQDEFDTTVLQLPWNDLLADRPTPSIIADAARRSTPDEQFLNWYPDPGQVPRPLDVLICQRSNLGWGATLHRSWAGAVLGLTVGIVLLVGVLTATNAAPLIAFAPLLPALRELGEIVRGNWDSANAKTTAERAVMTLWRRALADPSAVSEGDLRRVQDRLLTLRQTNASLPDWFHNLRRSGHEASMRDAAGAQVSEARQRGWA